MNYTDPPLVIYTVDSLIHYSIPSPLHSHLVLVVCLEKVNLNRIADYILGILANRITISHLYLTNSRLGARFEALIAALAESSRNGFHLTLACSLRSDEELQVLISSGYDKILSLNISGTAPLDVHKSLSHFSCANKLSTLSLDSCLISYESAWTICQWLQSQNSSLSRLSLRKCGLGIRGGEKLQIVLSGLVGNNSLEELDLSDNHLNDDNTLEALLGILECVSIRSLWLEHTKITAQIAFILGFIIEHSSLRCLYMAGSMISTNELSALVAGCSMPPTIPSDMRPPEVIAKENESSATTPSEQKCSSTQPVPVATDPASISPRRASDGDASVADVMSKLWLSEDHVSMCRVAYNYAQQAKKRDVAFDVCGFSSPMLVCLDLSDNRIADVRQLAHFFAPRYGLSVLNISGNPIADGITEFLAGLTKAENLQVLDMSSCGIGPACEGIFRSILMKWTHVKTCAHPLVSLQYECHRQVSVGAIRYGSTGALSSSAGRYCTSSGALEWEREGDMLHMRDGCDDLRRGLSRVTGPPYSRVVPPLTILRLQNNQMGWAAAALLGAVIAVRPWHPLRELYLEGSFIGTRGFQEIIKVLERDNNITHFSIRQADLVDDEFDISQFHMPSKKLMYTVPWLLRKKLTFLLCLKEVYNRLNSSRSGGCVRQLPEDALVVIFSFLRIPIYRIICVHS